MLPRVTVKLDPTLPPLTDQVADTDTSAVGQLEEGLNVKVARRLAVTVGAFVIAWIALFILAQWLFGSGNILIWVLAAVFGALVYLEVLRPERRLR